MIESLLAGGAKPLRDMVPVSMVVPIDILRGVNGTDTNNPDVAEACCRALWTLIGDTETRQKSESVPGSMGVLANVLSVHGRSNLAVATVCCGAIWNFVAADSDEGIAYNSVPGSIQVLVDVLTIHGHKDAVLAEACLGVISNVAAAALDARKSFGSIPKSFELLVNILRTYRHNNFDVATACCGAIRNLTASIADSKAKYGAVKGSIKILVNVLRESSGRGNAATVKACCGVVTSITRTNADIREMFGHTKVFSGIINAIKAAHHGGVRNEINRDAFKHSLLAIESLCIDHYGNKARFYSLDAARVIQCYVPGDVEGKVTALAALR